LQVEIYMQTVLDAMKMTLFQNLRRSLVRYKEMTRPEWLMHKDSKTGRPSDPAQIILLTLAVNYVAEVREWSAGPCSHSEQLEADVVCVHGGS
jgi:dynein heavy chain, axonemal